MVVLLVGSLAFLIPGSSGAEVVLNGGFETLDGGFPGGAQNWYASTGGTNSFSGVVTPGWSWSEPIHSGSNGWLLEPHTQGNNDVGTASVGSDHWAITGGSQTRQC